MKHPTQLILLLFVCLLGLITGACTSTQVEESWRLPDYRPPAAEQTRVLVLAMTRRPDVRKMVELEFVQQLEHQGISAMASHRVVPGNDPISRDRLRPIVEQNGITSVLISSLRGIDKVATYQPPMALGPRDNLSRNMDTYMVYSSSGQHEPGTYVDINEYLLETNLFRVPDNHLVWTVRTRTRELSDREHGVKSVVSTVLEQAQADRVLPSPR